MTLIDHHCHLDFPELEADRAGILERAAAAGVCAMITISTRVKQFDRLRAIVEAHDNIFCSVGTHPHYADEELDVTADHLIRMSEHPKVVAIGEAGLDYHYQRSSPEGQAAGFRTHIEAARATGLPLEIHARDADADTIAILEDEYAKGAFPAILHCFTGGAELARRAVALGLYVSFTGVVTFKRSDALRAIANDVPLERILIETDAPYLAPVPYRGKRNEPSYVAETAKVLAEARGLTADAFAQATTDNVMRLFAKLPRDLVPAQASAEAGA
ncbi:MAG: TatD family hydrolase [Pseudomonadota bacterium]